jgi:hypothetical protein
MRNMLLASTAALMVGITFASAQNMPSAGQSGSSAQTERGSAGADKQQGRDAQRGAEESKQSGARDKQDQSQRSEGREQREQTTGQKEEGKQGQREPSSQSKGKQGQRDQSSQGQSKQGQRDQSNQGQSKQSDTKGGETQRDQNIQREQREQTQGRQQGQSDQTKQGQSDRTQQGQPQQGKSQQSQPQQSQPQQNQAPAQQGQAQPNSPNQAGPNQQGQVQPNQAQQGQAGGNATLTSEQRTRIQQTVFAGNNVPRVNNVNFTINVGVAVPRSVRVVDVPPTLIEIYPQWRGHQYFVVQDDIVIVDRSRKIVARVPVGSSGGGSARTNETSGAQVGNTAGVINLGPDEIRQVQIVLRERGFYQGEPDGILNQQTTQALIAFQQQQGFQASGRIDTQTVTALGVSTSSTTGQTGNTMQQQPANQNAGAGQQGTQGGNQPATSTAPSGANTMQQQPANQNVGAGQQTGNQSVNQPSSTTGQSGQTGQPSSGNQNNTESQPAARPQSGNPNSGSRK